MTHNFIDHNRDQQHLLPKDISDWVEEDSLKRFISDTIDYLDTEGRLDPFYPQPREDGRGRPSFHPVVMLKVLVFVEKGANAEWSLFSATHDLLKLWRSGRGPDSHAVADTIAR